MDPNNDNSVTDYTSQNDPDLCDSFVNGCCQWGDACNYTHPILETSPWHPKNKVKHKYKQHDNEKKEDCTTVNKSRMNRCDSTFIDNLKKMVKLEHQSHKRIS